MTFIQSGFAQSSASFGSDTVPAGFTYKNAADTLATIKASAYFNSVVNTVHVDTKLYLTGSDGSDIVKISSATGVTPITVAAFIDAGDIADGSVTNAKVNAAAAIAYSKMAALAPGGILVGNVSSVLAAVGLSGDASMSDVGAITVSAGAITKAKLDSGVQASHMIVFGGQPTTTGGAAAEAFTVTGALATDLAFVQVVADGTSNVTAIQAVVTSDTLTVTFSADPVADTVFNYQIVRATS